MPKKKKHPADPKTGAQRGKLNVLPYDLVPFQEFTDAYIQVAEAGIDKGYDAWNWTLGLKRTQIIGSLLRHTFAYLRGEDNDPETGLNHSHHIMWNSMALVHSVHHNLEDDRRKEPPRDYKDKSDGK